jgi:hypothetical protein
MMKKMMFCKDNLQKVPGPKLIACRFHVQLLKPDFTGKINEGITGTENIFTFNPDENNFSDV